MEQFIWPSLEIGLKLALIHTAQAKLEIGHKLALIYMAQANKGWSHGLAQKLT